MREFLQTIFKSTEDRIKNPFIGAFLTSAILFNWRPILYLIFSNDSIKDKIKYIDINFNDSTFYLWLPFAAAIFYIGILPYINLGFEWIVKFSISGRNNVSLEARKANLKLQIEVAQNEITLEEEKTTFRERNSHNKMVENLQVEIANLTLSLDESNNNYLNISKRTNEEKNVLNQNIENLKEDSKIRLNDMSKIIEEEKNKYRELLNDYTENKNLLAKYEFTNADLNDALIIENFKFNRFKKPINKIVTIDKLALLEFFVGDDIVYYDIINNAGYSLRDIALLPTAKQILPRHDDEQSVKHYESQFLYNFPNPKNLINN